MSVNISELSHDRINQAVTFSIGYAIIALIVSLLAGAVTVVLWQWPFAAVTLCGLFAGGIAIASVWVSALQDVQWMCVQTAAAEIEHRNAETERLQAEAEAIRGAQAGQLAINTGSGTVKQTFKPTVYRHNGQVVNGNQLNQLNQAEPRRLEIPAADVRWFAEQIANGYGHSKSKWVISKVELPYSRLVVDWTIYKALIDPLAEGGAIVGRGERSAGRLVVQDPAQLVKVIEQRHPGAGSKGLVLELPSEATAAAQ